MAAPPRAVPTGSVSRAEPTSTALEFDRPLPGRQPDWHDDLGPSHDIASDVSPGLSAARGLNAVSVDTCKGGSGLTGTGHVSVTLDPAGAVKSAQVDGPPFAGTAVGDCVVSRFLAAKVPAFRGAAITVSKRFEMK
jgi:hypothetical protein